MNKRASSAQSLQCKAFSEQENTSVAQKVDMAGIGSFIHSFVLAVMTVRWPTPVDNLFSEALVR